MSDEMKLITALCEALGFDVQRTVDVTKGIKVRTHDRPHTFGTRLFSDWAEHEFIGNGQYVEVTREVSYKLTKQEDRVDEFNSSQIKKAMNSTFDISNHIDTLLNTGVSAVIVGEGGSVSAVSADELLIDKSEDRL